MGSASSESAPIICSSTNKSVLMSLFLEILTTFYPLFFPFCNNLFLHALSIFGEDALFVFNLLWINDLYMFRALLAHLQEALHKQQLVYFMRVMSSGCYQSWSVNWYIACVLCLLAAPGAFSYILRFAVNKILRIFPSCNKVNSSGLLTSSKASKFRMFSGPKYNGRVWFLSD
jgi:hypothetical protein